jgi:glycosyltransferase involved in cell wall biosynthesis
MGRRAPVSGLRFSVVVTSYNYRAFVREAVDSALAQSLKPLEVIVVDDGSTDGSAEFLREAYAALPAVKIIATENRGQLAAFRTGVEAAQGDVIAFLDADDYWDAGHLASLADGYAAERTVDFVFTNLVYVGAKAGTWFPEGPDRDEGLSVCSTYFMQHRVGGPTSALSLRTAMCRRLLQLTSSIEDDWRIRADDCIVLGASLLGAHKFYRGAPTVSYRVHADNRWMNKPEALADSLKHHWRIRRMLEVVGEGAGVRAMPPMAPVLEFKSHPGASWSELLLYSRLIGRTPWPLHVRWRQRLGLLKHKFGAS